MSNGLSGSTPLGYQGTNAPTPPNITRHNRAPTPNNYQNFSIGDFWIYIVDPRANTNLIYVLLGVVGNVADWELLTGSVGALITLTGNTGTAFPSAANINIVTDNATPKFVGSGSTITLDFGLDTLILGNNKTSGGFASCVGLGKNVFGSVSTTAIGSTFVGAQSGELCTATASDTGIGSGALANYTHYNLAGNNTVVGASSMGNFISGDYNTTLGALAGAGGVLTGSYNTLIGQSLIGAAGTNYRGAESSNLLINNIGVVTETNVIRIGTTGNSCRSAE